LTLKKVEQVLAQKRIIKLSRQSLKPLQNAAERKHCTADFSSLKLKLYVQRLITWAAFEIT
jgi:hypothetical protein